eukprot:m.215096 g.215096  ORF g.215096 m.215096 type:complete len:127 (+) comp27583_c0_seq1:1352-1732(+)
MGAGVGAPGHTPRFNSSGVVVPPCTHCSVSESHPQLFPPLQSLLHSMKLQGSNPCASVVGMYSAKMARPTTSQTHGKVGRIATWPRCVVRCVRRSIWEWTKQTSMLQSMSRYAVQLGQQRRYSSTP